MTPPFLTCCDVAERWGVSERQVQRMVARREIAHMRVGRHIRIPFSAVELFERTKVTRG